MQEELSVFSECRMQLLEDFRCDSGEITVKCLLYGAVSFWLNVCFAFPAFYEVSEGQTHNILLTNLTKTNYHYLSILLLNRPVHKDVLRK